MKRSFFIPISALWLLTSSFSPAIVDVNENGLSDFWERQYNAEELFSETFDPQADYDADGWNNAQEAAAGTDPYDANPPDGFIRPVTAHFPAVMGEENGVPVVITPEAVTVSWPTLAGKQYTLLFSPDLSQGSWLPVEDPFIANGSGVTYNFPISQADKCFWRVAVTDVDTDGDGMNDHEESQSGSNPATTDSDDDDLTDLEEAEMGTDPNAPDTDDDESGDAEDAVPLDAEINWPKSPETRYVWIEQTSPPPMEYAAPPIATNSSGQILFQDYVDRYMCAYDLNYIPSHVLWDSATRQWINLPRSPQTIPVDGAALELTAYPGGFIGLNDVGTVAAIGTMHRAVAPGVCGAHDIMAVPGMIWKRSGGNPTTYGPPQYHVYHGAHSAPPCNIVHGEEDVPHNYNACYSTLNLFSSWGGSWGVTARLGADDSMNHVVTFISNNHNDLWSIYDPASGSAIFDQPVKTLGYNGAYPYYSRPGAILDKNCALLVENVENPAGATTATIWYKEGASVSAIASVLPSDDRDQNTGITRAPSKKDDDSERLWIAAGSQVLLEKRAGDTGTGRWHAPTSMGEGAIRLNAQGEAITRGRATVTPPLLPVPPKLWRNGKYTDLNELTSKPETVTITQAIDLASNGIILATANDDGVGKTGILLPLDMTISYPELDGDDPPDYVVNADVAETLITVGITPAGDGSIIEWQIEEGNGTLSVTESTTTDGFASTTLTTSTNAGDTYRVKARIKKLILPPHDANSQAVEFDFTTSAYANLTGIEQTTDVITVIPGYAASITVLREPAQEGGSTTDIPADGESGMTFVATVKDQFGQPVAEHTPVVWHLGGLGSIEPETPATDSSGIVRAHVVAGDALGQQTVRIEADGFEVTETLENSAVTGTLTAGASTLDITTGASTTLTAAFPDVADGATVRWYASRGEILNAASSVEGGQATATLRAGGGRIGNAMVTASVGGTTHATEIDFVSTSPISVEVDHPVIVGDETTAGAANVPQIDGTSQSVAYHTSTPVTIKAPAYAGHTATVQFGSMTSDIVARLPFDEINGGVTPDMVAANDAAIQGAVLDANHRHEGAASLYFDGATSSLSIADHANLRIQDGLTVSAWVHAAASTGTIIAKPGEYRLFIDGQERVVFGVTTSAGEELVVGPSLPLHRWCRISASCEQGGVITISLDGMKATSQISGNLTPGTNAITIGESFEGWLDLLEISLGKQFISGTELDVTGLSGGQVVLDGNGEAVVNVASGAQSVVSAANPVQGVAIRVSINPEVKLEDVVVVATKDAFTVLDAAMSDMKVTTASQTSNLSGTTREDVVARNLLEFASTGQRSSALPFVPAGNITDRLRYAHRASLWLGESVDAAHDVRDILENSHPLDLPTDRKYHLSDQVQVLLMESIRGGSDSGANQYLDDAYGGLVGTLAGLSGQANFKHLTTLVDGGTAFEDLALVHENHGAELIEDIAVLAEHEAAEPTFCQRILGIYRTMNDVANGQWQQTVFDNTEGFIRNYCQQGVDNGKLDASEAFDIGFGWGLAAEAQAMSQLTNQRAARRLSEQMAATVMLAIKGDENARKGLKEAVPILGLMVMNDETNNLIEQEKYFDAGMKSAQLSVGIVSTAATAGAIVGGMAKGAVSLSRAAKNAAKPIKGVPPRLPASFGRAITQNYRKTFFDANPDLQGKGYWVHHAVPQDAIKKGWITWQEGHSLPNLRGIPPEINIDVHLGEIAKAWNAFKKPYLKPGAQPPTKEALLKFATDMDDLHGKKFDPKTR